MSTNIFRVALRSAAALAVIAGLVTIMRGLNSSAESGPLARAYIAFGSVYLALGLTSAALTFLARRTRLWLVLSLLILFAVLPVAFFAAFWIDLEKGELHRRQFEAEVHSGRHAFGDQPALLAVAQALGRNDREAIRAAAQSVADLRAAGRDGTTLLSWAVRETWQRAELAEAVATLLSLGVDPNYTNGQRESFAMANAVHGPARVLAAMLAAGGDPNARDEFGRPIILMNWHLGYYPDEQRARLELLLDYGADINSVMPPRETDENGYTLLLHRTAMGRRDVRAYDDAVYLLERAADPTRAAADGTTLPKMLAQHREDFGGTLPPGFARLWEWAETHGILAPRN